MEIIKKRQTLLFCNDIATKDLIAIIQGGEITLDEFIQANLDQGKIVDIQNVIKSTEDERKKEDEMTKKKNQKTDVVKDILRGRTGADKIQEQINAKSFSFDDLLDEGLSLKTVNSLKHYCSTNRIRKPKTLDQLPPMQDGRTDVYFVGVAGSGKSTMLAGLLKTAHMNGILLPDPKSNNEGSLYQTELIQDLNKGVLPKSTQIGSYNYIALSLQDENGKNHPFNIVDVPGENYTNIFENAEVESLLKYIGNNNKKILIFVVDSLAHNEGYISESQNQLDQSLAYVNILQMFQSNGVLEQTDAVYFIVNKYDEIKEIKYPHDERPKGDHALEYMTEEFLSLLENCKSIRKSSNNKFKIKVMPFSIGSIAHKYILTSFDKEFTSTLIKQLLKDSFVIRGGAPQVFK